MITTFRTTLSGLTAQPAAEKIIARSSSAADTTQTLTASGTVAAAADTDALSLLGQREVEGAKTFTALASALLSATCAGTVTIRGQGTKAEGRIIGTANMAEGDTLVAGLTGFTKTYTARYRAQSTAVCYATAGLTQGDYFDIALSGASAHRFWYDIDAAGTGAPADPGGGLTLIGIATGDTDAQVATKTEAVLEVVTNLTCSVSTNTVTIDYDLLGTMTVTDGPGDAVGTITAVHAGTADAANQVAIGATASDTMVNLRRAIRDGDTVIGDGTGEGSLYGTGTAAHTQFTISAISGTILTTQDLLACHRQIAWSFTQTGTGLSLGAPTGGVDGALLVTIAIGDTARTAAISLDDEALTSTLLPPLTTFVSDWMTVGGKNCTLYPAAENVTTPLTVSYDIATDTAHPIAGATSLTSLDNNRYAVTPAEMGIEKIRVSVTNPNAVAASVNFKMVTG